MNDFQRTPSPLVSIVIPTKDRYATLLPVVDAILRTIDDPALQLVIQDNTRDNAVAIAALEALSDPRIIYAHRADPCSIVVNTEAALDLAGGEFVTFIGDDDLVSPHIVDFARNLADTRAEVVTYPGAYYWWSTVSFARPSRYHRPGALWYRSGSGRPARWLSPRVEVDRVLHSGGVSIFDLPRLYHGLVRRAVLKQLKMDSGRYVHGASPDMALALALGLRTSHQLMVDSPLTIYGASRNSGGGFTARNQHYGKLEDQPHLPRSTVENWNPRLPRVWSEHTVYPQTVNEVLSAFGMPDLLNYTAFYASMLINEPHLRSRLWPYVGQHLKTHPGQAGAFVVALGKKLAGRVRRDWRSRIAGMPFELVEAADPQACMRFLQTRPAPLLQP